MVIFKPIYLGAPFQWAAIFHKEDMQFENGVSGLSFYNSSQKLKERQLPCKVSCSFCHSPVMDEGRNMVLLFPELLDLGERGKKDFEVRYGFFQEPLLFVLILTAKTNSCHIFYSQRVVDIDDGKPKWSELDESSDLMSG